MQPARLSSGAGCIELNQVLCEARPSTQNIFNPQTLKSHPKIIPQNPNSNLRPVDVASKGVQHLVWRRGGYQRNALLPAAPHEARLGVQRLGHKHTSQLALI